MKRSWDLKPNLVDCILEERIVPAIANLGVIIQTTNGLALVTAFPGAASLSALSGGGTGSSAPSVSGAAMPTSFYVTGRGISSFAPGNYTGNASIVGAATAASGAGGTIRVGSGSDDARAPVLPTLASSRNNQGSNGATAPTMAYIGSVSTGSSSTVSSTSPTGTTQTAQSAPVPSLRPLGVVTRGSPSSMNGNPTNPMGPQSGAPRFMMGLTGKLVPSLPGGLGVTTSLAGTGAAGN